jgi:hypothetical protein
MPNPAKNSEVRIAALGGYGKMTLVPGLALMTSYMQSVTPSLSVGSSLQVIPSRGTGLAVGFRYAPPATPALDKASIDKRSWTDLRRGFFFFFFFFFFFCFFFFFFFFFFSS